MAKKNVIKATSNAEIVSFILNQNPELKEELGLPTQGQDMKPLGKLFSSDERYKNAFLNIVNVIGLTMIQRNAWENPWEEFTNRGELNYGQQIREIWVDLCNVYDYNEFLTKELRFAETVVPNVFEYIHDLNFQKFYQTTTSDEQIAMAFDREGGIYDLIDEMVSKLYTSWQYDKYILNKYILCRRIVDGTITSIEIDNFDSLTARQRVSKMKNISNKMIFMSPNYNPAGVKNATKFEDQILIMNTDFEAELETEVIATSFFRDSAEFKTRSALVDGFGEHDDARLTMILKDQYVKFTSDELTELAKVPAVIISRKWFMNFYWNFGIVNRADAEEAMDRAGMRFTDFFNPTTLKNNRFLHVWACLSSSPFEQAAVFTKDLTPAVSSVTVSPSSATMSPGTALKLSATVATTGFANKAVTWSVDDEAAKINEKGFLEIPIEYTGASALTVTATSIFDSTKTGTSSITVVS